MAACVCCAMQLRWTQRGLQIRRGSPTAPYTCRAWSLQDGAVPTRPQGLLLQHTYRTGPPSPHMQSLLLCPTVRGCEAVGGSTCCGGAVEAVFVQKAGPHSLKGRRQAQPCAHAPHRGSLQPAALPVGPLGSAPLQPAHSGSQVGILPLELQACCVAGRGCGKAASTQIVTNSGIVLLAEYLLLR